MKTAPQPFAAPSFGKSLAVFLTVFALVFAPCVPVSGLGYGSGMGVKSAWAQNYTFASGGTVGNESPSDRITDAENVNVTDGGNLTKANIASTDKNGGAVIATGNFVVEGTGTVNFTNNNATYASTNGTGSGGAIYANGNVIISGTGNNTFANNNASNDGGVIYTSGNVTLSGGNNTFTGNTAQGGGAIYVTTGTVNISGGNSTFTGNKGNDSSGGAIAVNAGNVNISGGNNTFTGNEAAVAGGAIFVIVGNVTLSGGNNTFTGNKANNGPGGGIRAVNGTFIISGGNNTFTENTATSNGGALSVSVGNVNISGASTNTFTGNNASGDLGGGGINTQSGTVTLSGASNNTFTNNSATGVNTLGGGAIYGGGLVTLSGTGNNTFTNNSASASASTNGSSGGGAIYAAAGINISSGNNTFTNNSASISAASVSGSVTNSGGGAIYASGTVTLSGTSNNTFTNNSASADNAYSGGGAIFATNAVTLSGGNNNFTGNNAIRGGAIFTSNGNVTLSGGNNNFTGNNATRGGAIFAKGNVTLSGGNNNFTGNNASGVGQGGAIYASANLTISGGNNTFTGNNASGVGDNNNGTGGAIYAGGKVTISGGTNTFTGNNASGNGKGGAIHSGGNVTISGNATFEKNTATTGGAINAGNIFLTPAMGNTITFKNASDTLATSDNGWLHIGGEGNTNFEDGFNNPKIDRAVHFGNNSYKVYNASAGWTSNSTLNVTKNSNPLNTAGWALTTGSGRSTPYSNITGNFVLGDSQTLSLDMNVASKTSVPYFTVNDGNVTTGTNTTLHGVIGSALSTAGTYTYVVFNVTNGNGTGFAPANYTTNNALVTLANPTFYGDETNGTFTVDVVRKGSGPGPGPSPDPKPDPGNGTVIPKNETHSGGVSDNGGGLHSNGTTSITQNATANFTGNTARDSGGGLHSAGSVTVLDNASAVFVNNSAANKGGGIYSGGDIASTGATQFVVSGNTANQGGGVYANGTITLTGHSSFADNTAKESGGAIFATGDVNIIGSAEFSGNTANGDLAGGAIHTDNDVHVTPDEAKTIRFITHSDSIHSNNLYVDGIGTGYFNASNVIANTVYVQSGTAHLAAPNTFSNTTVVVEGGILHMGSMTSTPKARMANTAFMGAVPTAGGVTGSGASVSYATNLKGFHMADGTTLSLDMNVAGNADVPYFTLANGYAATTGTGTTLYGVIGQNLLSAAEGKWTYSIFSGSNGAAEDFAPANYRTSNALVSLSNPAYANGEFTVDVVRNNQPAPNPDPPVPPVPPVPPTPDPDPNPPVPPVPPVPPTPKPVITGDFMGLFPAMSLASDMEMILYYDYFYNGGTIANPGPGTLIGSNAFLDGLMFVLPNGQEAFSRAERLLALEGAASMTDMSGAIDLLRDTGNRLRGQIFATDAVRNNRATMTKANDGTRVSLWATPTYSHETGRERSHYGSVDANYSFNTYGGVIGADVLFADGKFRVGGVLTVGHGKVDSILTTNDADYVGGALFGAWLPTPEWEIGIYTGYIGQKNDVSQSNILNLKSDFDTSLWQIGANVQYSTSIGNNGKRKLSAGVGVDAQMYTRDSHGISSNGKDIANMSKSDLTQVQIPLTVGLQDTFDFENGSSLTLDGRMGYRLTLGDLATKSDWSIPGGNHKARVTGPDADRNTALVGVGALWKKNQLSLGVAYDAEFGTKRTNHQLSGQVRWDF